MLKLARELLGINGRTPPRGRTARIGGSPIIARVTFGPHDGSWCHPEIEIGHPAGDDDSRTFAYYPKPVVLRFQMHRITSDDMGYQPEASGFMRPSDSRWSGTYGVRIVADADGGSALAFLGKVCALIERARKAAGPTRYGGPRARCEMSQLLIGLQRCGVEIGICSRHLRDLRARRATVRALDRERAQRDRDGDPSCRTCDGPARDDGACPLGCEYTDSQVAREQQIARGTV